ncbi:MAG: response regulator [Fibrobacterota bacterium]
MKIMVVDDSVTMRRIIVVNLKKAGYNDIVEAESGRQALGMLRSPGASGGFPDVMLLDWNMPEMTGIELLKAVKSDDTLRHLPIIMVTTESEKERVLMALQSGAMGYLVKPITPDSFQKQVVERLPKK